MKKINIYEKNENMNISSDYRGMIADVFNNADIKRVVLIKSEARVERGKHYHKKATQYVLVIHGSMELWWNNLYDNSPPKNEFCFEGDLITLDPYDIHEFIMNGYGCNTIEFFTENIDTADYEADSFKVPSLIP